jgi:phosphate:Na+ symporter
MAVPVYLGWYGRLIEAIIPGPVTQGNIMVHIALAHTVFNVINSVFVFLPLVGLLERAAVKLTPSRKDSVELAPMYLERHLLNTPTVAIQQAIKELIRMAEMAKEALEAGIACFFNHDPSLEDRVRKQEEAVDHLQKEITQYLIEISEKNLDATEAEEIPVLVHSVNDVERIGDHAENIIELATRKQDQRLEISGTAIDELKKIADHTLTMFDEVLQTLREQDDAAARRVLQREEQLNTMQVELKESHVRRLQNQECLILSGLLFVSFVDNLEKIGDHVTNIAQASLRHLRWSQEIELDQ